MTLFFRFGKGKSNQQPFYVLHFFGTDCRRWPQVATLSATHDLPGKDERFKMVDGIILKSFSENLHSDSKFVNFGINSN
jgi:hypothetical protein